MTRTLLLCLLSLLSPALLAGDLEQQFPAATVQQILAQLPQSKHRHFAVVDYSRHSSEPRFFLFDRQSHVLLDSYRVSHGKGSDRDHDGYADHFSDTARSLASSLGTYRTGEVYQSQEPGHGLSMRLLGLSSSNSNAERRAIVVHAQTYMEESFIRQHGVPGRSHGCLVLSRHDRDRVVTQLHGGALIFAIDTRDDAIARR